MLGISRIRIGRMRSHRASITRMHGRAKATAQEEEQHQLPPVKIQEVPRGQHEEEINTKHKDWRKFGHRFGDWFDDENLRERRPPRSAQWVLATRYRNAVASMTKPPTARLYSL